MMIGLAVSRFNQVVTARLLAGAQAELARRGIADIEVLEVPGAWELPLGVRYLLDGGCDGVVALGAVIRGETDHYEVIVRESAAGLMRVSLEWGKPVGNAVLTVENLDQALARSEPGPGNKGAEAAAAVVELASHAASLPPPEKPAADLD